MIDLSLSNSIIFLENIEPKEIQEKLYNNEKNIHRNLQTQMSIKNKNNENILGYICSYNYNKIDGYIYIDFKLENSNSKKNVLEACKLFFNYLFTCFPIRKIYFDGYKYSLKEMGILKEIGFELEGNLKEHNFFYGKYCDKYILSLYRKVFYKELKNVE